MQKVTRSQLRALWPVAVGFAALATAGCAANKPEGDLSMAMVTELETSGAVLPMDRLNSAVLQHHPNSQVEHAALDKDGDHYVYQALVTDRNKMQWFMELDARTGQPISDKEE